MITFCCSLVQWLKHSRKEYCELCKHRFAFTPSKCILLFLFFQNLFSFFVLVCVKWLLFHSAWWIQTCILTSTFLFVLQFLCILLQTVFEWWIIWFFHNRTWATKVLFCTFSSWLSPILLLPTLQCYGAFSASLINLSVWKSEC